METLEIIIAGVVAIAIAGGAIFTYKKSKSKKVNIKNVKIHGSGKVIAGDDNSTHISDNRTNPT
ncbi:hypothetical protein [Bacteroides sp.]